MTIMRIAIEFREQAKFVRRLHSETNSGRLIGTESFFTAIIRTKHGFCLELVQY